VVLHSISEVDEVTEKLANPAPLGLLGFGTTTVLLNLHNAGFYPLNSMILAMGLAYGGLAQVIAGIMEYKKGNTFGTVAFSSYGLFWWSLVLLLVFPRFEVFDLSASSPLQTANSTAMAAYFFKPCTAVRIPKLSGAIFSLDSKRANRNHRPRYSCRIRGNNLRIKCCLYSVSGSVKRSLRKKCFTFITNQQEIESTSKHFFTVFFCEPIQNAQM